jgi:hypothetical protein
MMFPTVSCIISIVIIVWTLLWCVIFNSSKLVFFFWRRQQLSKVLVLGLMKAHTAPFPNLKPPLPQPCASYKPFPVGGESGKEGKTPSAPAGPRSLATRPCPNPQLHFPDRKRQTPPSRDILPGIF